MKTISFIIASYNDPNIYQTIKSITSGANPNDQIIVIDGNSSDKTVESAKKALLGFNNHILISEPDTGIYDAWNKALLKASGNWISFLGCGDMLTKDYFHAVRGVISQHPKRFNFIHFKTQMFTESSTGRKNLNVVGRIMNKKLLKKKMHISQLGALHHHTLFESRKFDPSFRCVSDYHFLLESLSLLKPFFIDQILTDMEASGISSQAEATLREEYIMKKRLGGYSNTALRLRYSVSLMRATLSKLWWRSA